MLTVGIAGASGYGGGELLRLLAAHPDATVQAAVSETYAGQPIAASFPGLTGLYSGLRFTRDNAELAACDFVFLAQENGRAMQTAPPLLESGRKIVDLSADFRFRDAAIYAQWYAPHAAPEWNARAQYGLPELHRKQIKAATLVGNPGCYATAAILALAPLFAQNLVEQNSVIVDGKSGVSGAGRAKFSPDTHFSEINESVSAYKIAGTHRHTPEIEAVLNAVGATNDLRLTFTPHLIPMTRGILATSYANLSEKATTADLLAIYGEFYADAPFVHLLAEGATPATKHTLGSNRCHIGLAVDSRTNRITVVSALDNLIKGAAGQAVQNMNLMLGLDETAGLTNAGGIWP